MIEVDFDEFLLDIITASDCRVFDAKIEYFCNHIYSVLVQKFKAMTSTALVADFSFMNIFENFNKEVDEFVEKINSLEIVDNQKQIQKNLLFQLVKLKDPIVFRYYEIVKKKKFN